MPASAQIQGADPLGRTVKSAVSHVGRAPGGGAGRIAIPSMVDYMTHAARCVREQDVAGRKRTAASARFTFSVPTSEKDPRA